MRYPAWIVLTLLVLSTLVFAQSRGPGRFTDVYLDNQHENCLTKTDANGKIIEACDGEVDISELQQVSYVHKMATAGNPVSGWVGWEDAAMAAVANGKRIHFSKGRYNASKQLYFEDVPYFSMTGDGPNDTVIDCTYAGTNRGCVWVEPATGVLSINATLRDFTVEATGLYEADDVLVYLGNNHCKGGTKDGDVCFPQTNDCEDVGGECYSPHSMELFVENVVLTATDYDDATTLRVNNANSGTFNNLVITGGTGSEDTWGYGLDLFPYEKSNRGNLKFNGGSFTKIKGGARIGYEGIITNTITFSGTKFVVLTSEYRKPGSVCLDIYQGHDAVNLLGIQCEGFLDGVKVNGNRGQIVSIGSWYSLFAGGVCMDDTPLAIICDDIGVTGGTCTGECQIADGTAFTLAKSADNLTSIGDQFRTSNECENAGGPPDENCGTAIKLTEDNDGIVFMNPNYKGAFADFGTVIDYGLNAPPGTSNGDCTGVGAPYDCCTGVDTWLCTTQMNNLTIVDEKSGLQLPNYWNGAGEFRGNLTAHQNMKIVRPHNNIPSYDFYQTDRFGIESWIGRIGMQYVCADDPTNTCQNRCETGSTGGALAAGDACYNRCATGDNAGTLCRKKCQTGTYEGQTCSDSSDCDGEACDYVYDCTSGVACNTDYDCGSGYACDSTYDCGLEDCASHQIFQDTVNKKMAYRPQTGDLRVQGEINARDGGFLLPMPGVCASQPCNLGQEGAVCYSDAEGFCVCVENAGYGWECGLGGGATTSQIYSYSFFGSSYNIDHNLGTADIIVACYGSGDVLVEPDSVVIGTSDPWDIDITLSSPQSVRCVLVAPNGDGGDVNYSQSFLTPTSSVTLTHALGTKDILVSCYDTNGAWILPDEIDIDASDPWNAVVTFTDNQTGRCVVNGTSGDGGTANYTTAGFTDEKNVTVAHSLDTPDVIVQCYDTNDVLVEPESVDIGSSDPWDVAVEFNASQSGRCVASGSIGDTVVSPAPTEENTSHDFTDVPTVELSHNLGTKNVLVQCYDTNDKWILPDDITIDAIDPWDVTVNFTQNETGRCVVNGSGGGQGDRGPDGVSGPTGPTGPTGPAAVELSNYTQSFTSQTSVSLTHNLGTKDLIVSCYNGSDVVMDPDTITIAGTSPYAVTVDFDDAQSGRCVVNGSGGTSRRYTVSFTAQTTVTVTQATHGLDDAPLGVICFDNSDPRVLVEPDTVTYDDGDGEVVITFFNSETGKCVLQ